MDAPSPLRPRAVVLAMFPLLLLSPPAAANPIMMPDPIFFSRLVVFGLLWALVLLTEAIVLKLVLFGLDYVSWPVTFLIAFGVNLASAIVGGLVGMHFDFWAFEFYPSALAVFAVSLGVEGGILLVAFGRWRLRRALISGLAMNAASYLLLVLVRFPGGAQL